MKFRLSPGTALLAFAFACTALLAPRAAQAQLAYVSNNAAGAQGISAYNANGTLAFNFPAGPSGGTNAMVMGSNGIIYAAHNTSIDRFSQSGSYLGTFASSNLSKADGMAFDNAGNLYVADATLNAVQRFSPAGSFLGTFASGLHGPMGLAFDAGGNLYVANDTSSSVQRFSASGVNLGLFITSLVFPTGLAFDAAGNLYVGNYDGGHGSSAIKEYSAAGSLVRSLGVGNFNVPYGVSISPAGNIYGADTLFNRVIGFAPDGSSVLGIGNVDSATAILFAPVPEPASWALFAAGLLGMAGRLGYRRRRCQ